MLPLSDHIVDKTHIIRRALAWRLVLVATLLLVPISALVYFYIEEQKNTLINYQREYMALNLVAQVNDSLSQLFDIDSSTHGTTKNSDDGAKLEALLLRMESALVADHFYYVNTLPQWNGFIKFYKKQKIKTKIGEMINLKDGLIAVSNRVISLAGIGVIQTTMHEQQVDINTPIFSDYLAGLIAVKAIVNGCQGEAILQTCPLESLKKDYSALRNMDAMLIVNLGYFDSREAEQLTHALRYMAPAIEQLITDLERAQFLGVNAELIANANQRNKEQHLMVVKNLVADIADKRVQQLMAQTKDHIAELKQRMTWLFVGVVGMVVLALLLAYYMVNSLRLIQKLLTEQNARLENGITERTDELEMAHHRMEVLVQELKKETERSDAANKAKSLFLASMSHEIRTPLNAIICGTALLERCDFDAKQRDILNFVKGSGWGLLNLVNDILDFSKIEAGEMTIKNVAMDLEDIMIEALNNIADNAQKKNLTLVRDFDALCEGLWIGDPTRIRQIMINLLSNAIKFTDKGSITLAVNFDDRGIIISVSDTGIGMAGPTLDRLFQSFMQADNTVSRQYGGTGLGLSICRKLTELMHGSITVNSEYGHGSTFFVQLPLVRCAANSFKGSLESDFDRDLENHFDDHLDNYRSEYDSPKNDCDGLIDRTDDIHDAATINNSGAIKSLQGLTIYTVNTDVITRLRLRQWGADVVVLENEKMTALVHGSPLASVATTKTITKTAIDSDDHQFVHNILLWVSDAMPDGDNNISRLTLNRLCQTVPSIYIGAQVDDEKNKIAPNLYCYSSTQMPKSSIIKGILLACARQQDVMAYVANFKQSLKYSGQILLVEDVEFNRAIAAEFITDLGLQVDFAENGEQAVAAFKRKRYGLVLMDIHMPIMNGIEATKAIRAYEVQHAHLPTPIIALTADVINNTFNAIYLAGMDDIIYKPYEEESLHKIFSRYLPSYCQLDNLGEVAVVGPVNNHPCQQVPDLVFDANSLERRVRYKKERAVILLKSFNGEKETYLQQIKTAANNNERNAVASHAHALRGASANLGLMTLAGIAADLESLSHINSDSINMAFHINRLSEAMAAVDIKLNEYIRVNQ